MGDAASLARAATRVYRVLLVAYPPGFRRRHGDEMARLFHDRARAAIAARGAAALVTLMPGVLKDLAVSAAAEWVNGTGRGPRRNAGTGGGMGGMKRDVAWALRSLKRSPGFTAVAVLTIALALAANTAIFSVVQAVLLRPLPYQEPDRLAMVWMDLHRRNLENYPLSPPDFVDIRDEAKTFAGVAAVVTGDATLTDDGEPEQISNGQITWDFFDVLGVRPELGRAFVKDDQTPTPDGVQPGDPGFLRSSGALSHELWVRRFGADPKVIGRVLDLGFGPCEIVAVMPPGLQLLLPAAATVQRDIDIWTVARFDFTTAPRGNVFLRVIGRMRPGATLEQANADLDRVAAGARTKLAGWDAAGLDFRAAPLLQDLTAGVRPVILALMGAVAFVLLIACANVSNLLLVRATTRQRELAVRAAMGGSRTRLARQLLAESVLLALGGAVLGTALARVGIDVLLRFQPDGLPRLDHVSVDGTVLAFTTAAALAASILFGTLPALRASRLSLADSLKDRGAATAGHHRGARHAIVVAEVALSLVLLVGAGMMLRTFSALQRVELGFEPRGAVFFQPNLPFQRYKTAADQERFVLQLEQRLAGQPGVRAVSAGFPTPGAGNVFNGRWSLVENIGDPTTYKQASYYAIEPGFFTAMGTRLLEGRDVTAADVADSSGIAIVNRTLAEKAFPGESAVGKSLHVRASSPDPQIVQIVGVVEDQRDQSLTGPVREAVYFTTRFVGLGAAPVLVRSDLDLASVTALIKREVGALDAHIPVDVVPISRSIDRALAPTRFALVLISVFSAMALLMATVGIYSVLAFTVRQRVGEIGVRMAFGAERSAILRLVVGQGMALAAAGVVLGVGLSVGLRGLMARTIEGVQASDPTAFVAAPLFFLLIAALACLIPAVRATRVDPLQALRGD